MINGQERLHHVSFKTYSSIMLTWFCNKVELLMPVHQGFSRFFSVALPSRLSIIPNLWRWLFLVNCRTSYLFTLCCPLFNLDHTSKITRSLWMLILSTWSSPNWYFHPSYNENIWYYWLQTPNYPIASLYFYSN